MIFTDALAELRNGNYVTRGAWDRSREYLIFLPEIQYISAVVMIDDMRQIMEWCPLVADLIADDWRILSRVERELNI